ncbi:unnamed protein product, partial [Mesorhabditis spiculigera]
MLKLLKQFGASFEIQNYRGDLPLHEAVQAGSKEVADWLLQLHPTSLDAASHEGRTGLHLAAATGNIEMVVFLCSQGGQINPLMLYRDNMYTPLDLAKRKDHQVVVEYLTMRHSAKLATEVPEEERLSNKLHFEEQIVNAKLNRGKILRQESSSELSARRLRRRRTSSEMLIKATQTMTPEDDSGDKHHAKQRRPVTSDQARFPKSTSTTDLAGGQKDKYENRIERILQEEIRKAIEEQRGEKTLDSPRLVAKKSPRKDSSGDSSEEDLIMKRRVKAQIPIGWLAKIKVVRLNTEENDDEENIDRVGGGDNVMLRIKREPEFGDGEGDFAIYEDDWEELDTTKPTGKDARRRYIHEKAIFQELTHLKRMQIQYGKVQEKVLVRSLVGNFCKMHGLNPADFKFYTFYAWEKFLYDQLKLIYLEERERIAGQAGFSKNGAAQRFSRFENRLRQARAVPINDKVRELTRIYGNGTMTAGARSPNRKQRQQQPQPPSNSK